MHSDIIKLHFPDYADVKKVIRSESDMGEKTITITAQIPDNIIPDFSEDWSVICKGHKYIMPLRTPQATLDSETISESVDLTFQHAAIYKLKSQYFFEYVSVDTNVFLVSKYIVPLRLNLYDFVDYLKAVCAYHFGDTIIVDLNPDWVATTDPVGIDISYSFVWDVLIKIYELFGVRWEIVPNGDYDDYDHYIIKIGYETEEISHIFERGFEGGLLKIERQVQSPDLRNMLLGRGGEKNLPYRYYKDVDSANDSFAADPDWIPELKNVPFSNLMPATFRSYIQGWKAKHYNGTATKENAYAQWAWQKGYTDTKFDPPEYVKDDESIALYGVLMGGLEDNNDIYPTIQGIKSGDHPSFFVTDFGRVDEVIAVEEVQSDDVVTATSSEAKIMDNDRRFWGYAANVAPNGYASISKRIDNAIEIPEGNTGTLILNIDVIAFYKPGDNITFALAEKNPGQYATLYNGPATVQVYKMGTDTLLPAVGIPPGKYGIQYNVDVQNITSASGTIMVGSKSSKFMYSEPEPEWGRTFDIWVKDIWSTPKGLTESPIEFAERVWRPILGDHIGNEAKVVFSDGQLSVSEDYEFVITAIPAYDPSRQLKNSDGTTYHSMWRITLAKSDADLKSTGKYLPSTTRNAKAGNHFFFTGIDLPHPYVLWAEERLDNYKRDQLRLVADIIPTWVVSLDKVRIAQNRELTGALIDKLKAGASVTIFDNRLIRGSGQQKLYLQSITYTYNEPTSDSPAIIPDVEVVLSDKYEAVANPVATLSGEVEALSRQVDSISNVEQIMRAVGDKIYLRKDGFPDRSLSPTEFGSLVTSTEFRAGLVGGAGWGIFKNENGQTVIEADVISARSELQVMTLVANQVEGRGGIIVESAAKMEISSVAVMPTGQYMCYFDQKGGSVANLFKVGDIAWCSRYLPDAGSTSSPLKTYRRRVDMVTSDAILLSSTKVLGSGVPEAGDVIVQRGNESDPTRQYIIIRDVLGGGYERFIEGLDSVSAEGTEYFFVGRQAGMYGNRARLFIGNKEGYYLEWVNDELFIKGRINALSTVNDKTLGDIADNAQNALDAYNNLEVGGTNYAIGTGEAFRIGSGWSPSTTNKVINLYGLKGLNAGDQIVVSFDLKCSGLVISDSSRAMLQTTAAMGYMPLSPNLQLSGTNHYTYRRTVGNNITPDTEAQISIRLDYVGAQTGGYIEISNLKLEKGNVETDWSPSPLDFSDEIDARISAFEYVTDAFKQRTTLDGGVILSSYLSLGVNNETFTTHTSYAGLNGIFKASAPGNGIALWFGGAMADKRSYYAWDGSRWMPTVSDDVIAQARIAKGVDRFDGSGYRADGNFWWDVEGNVHLLGQITANGVFSGVSKKIRTVITDSNIGEYLFQQPGLTGTNEYLIDLDKAGMFVEFKISKSNADAISIYLPNDISYLGEYLVIINNSDDPFATLNFVGFINGTLRTLEVQTSGGTVQEVVFTWGNDIAKGHMLVLQATLSSVNTTENEVYGEYMQTVWQVQSLPKLTPNAYLN